MKELIFNFSTSMGNQEERSSDFKPDHQIQEKLTRHEEIQDKLNRIGEYSQAERETILQELKEFQETEKLEIINKIDDILKKYNIKNDVFTIEDTIGLFGNSIEPSFRATLNAEKINNPLVVSEIISVLRDIMQEYDQKEFHISRLVDALPSNKTLGQIDSESNIAFVRDIHFQLEQTISSDNNLSDLIFSKIKKLVKKNNLDGFTIKRPDGFDFYNPPYDENLSGEEKTNLQTQFELKVLTIFSDLLSDHEIKEKIPNIHNKIEIQTKIRMLKIFHRDDIERKLLGSSYQNATQEKISQVQNELLEMFN